MLSIPGLILQVLVCRYREIDTGLSDRNTGKWSSEEVEQLRAAVEEFMRIRQVSKR